MYRLFDFHWLVGSSPANGGPSNWATSSPCWSVICMYVIQSLATPSPVSQKRRREWPQAHQTGRSLANVGRHRYQLTPRWQAAPAAKIRGVAARPTSPATATDRPSSRERSVFGRRRRKGRLPACIGTGGMSAGEIQSRMVSIVVQLAGFQTLVGGRSSPWFSTAHDRCR